MYFWPDLSLELQTWVASQPSVISTPLLLSQLWDICVPSGFTLGWILPGGGIQGVRAVSCTQVVLALYSCFPLWSRRFLLDMKPRIIHSPFHSECCLSSSVWEACLQFLLLSVTMAVQFLVALNPQAPPRSDFSFSATRFCSLPLCYMQSCVTSAHSPEAALVTPRCPAHAGTQSVESGWHPCMPPQDSQPSLPVDRGWVQGSW